MSRVPRKGVVKEIDKIRIYIFEEGLCKEWERWR